MLYSSLSMTDGFEIVPSALDQFEAAGVATALQHSALERSRAGARHLMCAPVVQRLARDSRLVAIAARFVGPAAVPFRTTLFDKSTANNWAGCLAPGHCAPSARTPLHSRLGTVVD
jgi:hypothetical protein